MRRLSGDAVAPPAARATPPSPAATPAGPVLAGRGERIGGRSAAGERGAAADAGAPADKAARPPLAGKHGGATGGDGRASDGEAGPDRGAGAELRTAGNQTVGNPRPEDAEAEERECRQHDRHGVVDGRLLAPPRPAVNSPNRVEPMPMMTASTSTLMPEEMTLPSTRSAMKADWLNRPKGISTKPASVVSLNSMSVTKSWTARMKKASSTSTQAKSMQAIWMKFSKKAQ